MSTRLRSSMYSNRSTIDWLGNSVRLFPPGTRWDPWMICKNSKARTSCPTPTDRTMACWWIACWWLVIEFHRGVRARPIGIRNTYITLYTALVLYAITKVVFITVSTLPLSYIRSMACCASLIVRGIFASGPKSRADLQRAAMGSPINLSLSIILLGCNCASLLGSSGVILVNSNSVALAI